MNDMPEVYHQLKRMIKVYKGIPNLSEDSRETLRYMQSKVMELEKEYQGF